MKFLSGSITYEDAMSIDLKNNGGDIPDLGISVPYNQGFTAGKVQILIECKNVPIGSAVQFCCGKPGPDPIIYLPKTTVMLFDFTAGKQFFIPANFTSDVFAFYWSNGHAPLPGFNITLRSQFIVGNKGEE